MARKTPSRLELRRQAEAVEGNGSDAAAAKKKKAPAKKAPRARKTKEKVEARRRLVWVIYNGSMKEEGRFPYDQRAEAEERLEVLRSKSKKLYFLQPLKELIGDAPAVAPVIPEPEDDEPVEATPDIENESIDEDAELDEDDIDVDIDEDAEVELDETDDDDDDDTLDDTED